jgi:hypothetical protein
MNPAIFEVGTRDEQCGGAGVSPVILRAFTPREPTGGTPALLKQNLPQ